MAGIFLEINVDDKGTVKVKQFSDETKKAFEEMKKGPEQATKSLNSLRDSWIGVTAKIGIATAAIYAVKRIFYDTAKEIASAGNEIERMARTFNMSTDAFQKWSYVAKMADVDVQGLGMALQFLTRSMSQALQGSGDASKAFTALGIGLKDSTGKTKDQEIVLMEVIDVLGKYADGVNRDVLMMTVFGRSWMSIKPLIDQGTKAIEENKKEAERLSLILGKDVIKSLSESEDAFKKWSMTWKVAKMEIFEPFIKDIRNLLEELLGLKRAWAEGGIKGVWEEIKEQSEKYKIEELTAPAWVKEWVAGYKPSEIKKPEAPALTDLKEYFEKQKIYYESWAKQAEQIEKMAYGGMENAAFFKELEGAEELRKNLFEMRELVRDFGWEDYAAGLDAASEGTRGLSRLTIANTKAAEDAMDQMKVSNEIIQSFGTTLSSAWASNLTNMIKDSKNFGDAVKNIFTSIGDAFINTVTKMIANWLIFGSITGKSEAGGGSLVGGLWSGILGSLFKGEGGIFNSPTPAIIGESGPEAVIPLKSGKIPIEGKTGGETYIVINAIDTKTFEDYVRQNPGAILQVVNQNARSAGTMKNIIRGT